MKNEKYSENENLEYRAFVEKFKRKKTKDDCYTPKMVYDAIRNWACNKYSINPDNIVRPFWPDVDYKEFTYPAGCVVLDNPPFSILAEIKKFYVSQDIKFFLFAPALTLLTSKTTNINHIVCGCKITFENGAKIPISFVTNLDTEIILSVYPELINAIKKADELNRSKNIKKRPKYTYPKNVITPARAPKAELEIFRNECVQIQKLDSQKNGQKIFGGGLLLSDAATERVAAADIDKYVFELSEKEKEQIRDLNKHAKVQL